MLPTKPRRRRRNHKLRSSDEGGNVQRIQRKPLVIVSIPCLWDLLVYTRPERRDRQVLQDIAPNITVVVDMGTTAILLVNGVTSWFNQHRTPGRVSTSRTTALAAHGQRR